MKFFHWLDSIIVAPMQRFYPPKQSPEPLPEPPVVPVALPPEPIQPNPHVSLLQAFLDEICVMEGGSAYDCNNPGNIRCLVADSTNWNRLAIGTRHDFCIFPTEVAGKQALYNVTRACAEGKSPGYSSYAHTLGLADSGELNLYQYFEKRDPSEDGNDPRALAVRFGKKLNVGPETFKMKQLL
jgi:hypothetical protein